MYLYSKCGSNITWLGIFLLLLDDYNKIIKQNLLKLKHATESCIPWLLEDCYLLHSMADLLKDLPALFYSFVTEGSLPGNSTDSLPEEWEVWKFRGLALLLTWCTPLRTANSTIMVTASQVVSNPWMSPVSSLMLVQWNCVMDSEFYFHWSLYFAE